MDPFQEQHTMLSTFKFKVISTINLLRRATTTTTTTTKQQQQQQQSNNNNNDNEITTKTLSVLQNNT